MHELCRFLASTYQVIRNDSFGGVAADVSGSRRGGRDFSPVEATLRNRPHREPA
jgi:hypothetical protein